MSNTQEQPACGGSALTAELGTRFFGLGSALAIAISYTANKSIAWAIVHGIFSWLFVLYAAIVYP